MTDVQTDRRPGKNIMSLPASFRGAAGGGGGGETEFAMTMHFAYNHFASPNLIYDFLFRCL